MATLKRSDLERWNAQTPNGFCFDVERFVIWNEKRAIRDIKTADDSGAYFRFCVDWRVKYIGYRAAGYIPTLTITKWTPTGTKGVFQGGRPDEYTLGEPETKKSYKRLCDLAGTIDVNSYRTDHLTSGPFSLFC